MKTELDDVMKELTVRIAAPNFFGLRLKRDIIPIYLSRKLFRVYGPFQLAILF
jgi:cytochrome P450